MRPQRRAAPRAPLCALLCALIAALAAAALPAQEPAGPAGPSPARERERPREGGGGPREGGGRQGSPLRLRGQAILLDINARIMEQDRVVSWNESHRTVTIPGHSVELKLLGANVVVALQFTPYVQRRGARRFLVAQGQVWVDTPDHGVSYHASMQAIPLEFGEPIYFFPLGPVTEGAPSIEVVLTLYQYYEGSEWED